VSAAVLLTVLLTLGDAAFRTFGARATGTTGTTAGSSFGAGAGSATWRHFE
jgi:hypothetical protein